MISPLTSASLRGGRQRSCVDARGRSAQRAEGHGMPRRPGPVSPRHTPLSPCPPDARQPVRLRGICSCVGPPTDTLPAPPPSGSPAPAAGWSTAYSVPGAISPAAAGLDGSICRKGKPRPRTEAERDHPTGRRPMPLHPRPGQAAWTCGTGGSSTATMAGASARLVPGTVGYGN